MKKKTISTVAIGIIVIILSTLFLPSPLYATDVSSLPTKNSEAKIAAAPTPIPGDILTGKYIRIGVNPGGTLGVGNGSDPGTGFQYPIGPQYESLAIWWWGEGYILAYKTYNKTTGAWVDNVAYWQPGYGWPPPPQCNIKPISHRVLRKDHNLIVVRTIVQTADGVMQLKFVWYFPLQQKYVILNTQIMNLGGPDKTEPVRDIVYKRFVDWDIHWDTGNEWTSDSHSAYASYFNESLRQRYLFTVSGGAPTPGTKYVPYVDLYGWDDVMSRDPWETVQSHARPIWFDGAAMIHFRIGGWWSISPGVGAEVALYYQASEQPEPPY